jgi:hypothetical protein
MNRIRGLQVEGITCAPLFSLKIKIGKRKKGYIPTGNTSKMAPLD